VRSLGTPYAKIRVGSAKAAAHIQDSYVRL
jgi:hypothetical protein